MKKRAKKKDRFHGLKPHIARLYKAVEHYVLKQSGTVIVIGGIQTIQWPGESSMKYTVGIKCMGRKPVYPKPPSDTPRQQEEK